jgi:hypothetical protein
MGEKVKSAISYIVRLICIIEMTVVFSPAKNEMKAFVKFVPIRAIRGKKKKNPWPQQHSIRVCPSFVVVNLHRNDKCSLFQILMINISIG